jgi:hypothetical protein
VVEFTEEAENFLLCTTPRPGLRPTNSCIQWVQRPLPMGVKWLVCKVHHSCLSSAQMNEANNHFYAAHARCIINYKRTLPSVNTTSYSGRITIHVTAKNDCPPSSPTTRIQKEVYFTTVF